MIYKKLALFLLIAMVFSACKPTRRCGVFTFNGTVNDGADLNSLPMSLSFDFNPAACGSSCNCSPVGYIQIVRNYDLDDGTYIYPTSEKEDRATAYGWYIDRVEGRKWGYYGMNDNGTFASYLTPGSATTNAVLGDEPARSEAEPWINFWWQAVSAPVCIQASSSCSNRLLGYYFWSWRVDQSGHVPAPFHANAWKELDTEVKNAISEWNIQAPGLSKNVFPALSDL
jgi:hypothetical protein